jgi:hypothetical protein
MSHFYSSEGLPHFGITAKSARERGLFYSVTEILRVLHSQGLEIWKINSAIDYCFENPAECELDEYRREVKKGMYDDSALTLGTNIHDRIERILKGELELDDVEDKFKKFVEPCIDYFISKKFKLIDIEQIVVNPDEGYAGTADIVAETSNGQPFIMDWKSCGKIPSKPHYTQKLQISAYAVATFGLDAVMAHEVWGANAYISTTEINKRGPEKGKHKFKVKSYRPEELAKNYKLFQMVCALWRDIEGYDPRVTSNS